ncbi:glycosyltransferase [Clostridium butyricum]|uniref:glycosyltransferase n=1 Tax=Clostridium butyricum TaxID=1492 RepID=UPI002105B026|nr:glycosyltransferase [Clostridium butyricum]MCQ2014190.1 glycosyltransferase [Clostridium butyricum]MCQ2026280.1 glycosyltransferase [Clostridium butyricum]
MARKKLISIIIAVYNLENYIQECLESILSQEFDNYEIILIDNGSTDNSIEICQNYSEEYPDKIRYVKLPNPTIIGRPYVYGVNNMNGEYFMNVDGDDCLENGCLIKIAEIIKKKNIDLLLGTFNCINEKGNSNFVDAEFNEEKINNVSYDEAFSYLSELPNFHTFQWRFIVRRDILLDKDKQFVNKYILSDLSSRFNDCFSVLNYFIKAKSIFFLKDPFYKYRRRGGSLTSKAIYEDISIDYLKCAMMLINDIQLNALNSTSYKYYLNLINIRFELFRLSCNNISLNKYEYISSLLSNYFLQFKRVKQHNKNISKLYDLIYEYGAYEGFSIFVHLQNVRLLRELIRIDKKQVYIFPVGIAGESTYKLLNENGITVRAFIDNDKSKQGKGLYSIPCMMPDEIKKLKEKSEAIFIIASSYDNIKVKLAMQLMNLGINEENIIIR